MTSTPICMPHHSEGDNATKVRRRSTCRNSFRDIFLHDPFAHHLKHAFRFQVLPKNTLQKKKTNQFGFRAFCNSTPKFWNSLPQTIREADSSATFRRRLNAHLFSDCRFLFSTCRTHYTPKLVYVFPRLCPFCYL